MTEQSERAAQSWRGGKGWKIAFFVALLAFEVAREWAVIASFQQPTLLVRARVFEWGGFVTAEGRWNRIDGGEALIPVAVRIDCRQDRQECVETTVQIWDGEVHAPDVTTFEARFSPDAVAYENNQPGCVRYFVRIDLKLKKVLNVRERKANDDPNCRLIERAPRIEMQLGDGWTKVNNPLEGHFVPVLATVFAALRLAANA
jgi:hypothetical protein